MADSLIDSSIQLYPTRTAFNYVQEVYKMPDLIKATAIMEKLYERVKLFPDPKLVMLEFSPTTYVDGKVINGIREYEKERALLHFGVYAYHLNRAFGGMKWSISMLQKLMEINITDITSGYAGDLEFIIQRGYRIVLATKLKDYNNAISLAEQMPVSPTSPQLVKDYTIVNIYIEKGEYQKALDMVNTFETDTILNHVPLKLSLNALLGNTDEALTHYEKYKSSKYFIPSNHIFYSLALIDIKKRDFKNALVNLDSALNYRMTGSAAWMAETALLDRSSVYKSIGDAYTGLQQYEKARDNYTISLLSNPEYQPAIDGLAKLEVKYAAETAGDKTPPVITLLEPSSKRGLTVTSALSNVMVKGVASDPAGIKEVFINGQKIYSQDGGDFWSDVALKEGLNKITVAAVDMAGNKAEQTFEIEKSKAAENTAQSDIIAVTEKQGKNYCLLIAAQNYSDNNIPSLEDPIADAVKLKIVLKSQYNFTDENIISLFNPGTDDIKRQLLELTNTIQPEDNLLIFYAGHGIWKKEENKGYWLLTDSKYNDVNTWLPNKDVLNLIAKLPSRHTLLITDACFSGSLFKTRGIDGNAPVAIREMESKISRVAITSGNDTEVPEKSVFMKYLVKALSENKDQYLTAQKMFINQILEAVMTETKTEPRYGTLELAGHVGGNYIFSRKN